jgi:predicted phosphate transport protein (TIGR00153 family)
VKENPSMRFSLMPREEKFFEMFDEVAAILSRAAGKFLDMLTVFDRLSARSNEIKFEEGAGDEAVERIIKALDRSFITPFDREDIHTLATLLDDVLDNMEETAHRLVVFRIERPTSEAISMAKIIQECCLHLEQALRFCRTMKNVPAMQNHLKEIGRLENEADKIYRDTDSALFANPPDMLLLIKWRELYGWLEETVDACKDVAQVISEIIIKGS